MKLLNKPCIENNIKCIHDIPGGDDDCGNCTRNEDHLSGYSTYQDNYYPVVIEKKEYSNQELFEYINHWFHAAMNDGMEKISEGIDSEALEQITKLLLNPDPKMVKILNLLLVNTSVENLNDIIAKIKRIFTDEKDLEWIEPILKILVTE